MRKHIKPTLIYASTMLALLLYWRPEQITPTVLIVALFGALFLVAMGAAAWKLLTDPDPKTRQLAYAGVAALAVWFYMQGTKVDTDDAVYAAQRGVENAYSMIELQREFGDDTCMDFETARAEGLLYDISEDSEYETTDAAGNDVTRFVSPMAGTRTNQSTTRTVGTDRPTRTSRLGIPTRVRCPRSSGPTTIGQGGVRPELG